MAARSTTQGTPVKSCSNTRAGMKLISFVPAPSPRATVSTSSADTRRPSSLRNRFSNRILMENGSRSTLPRPLSASEARRKY
jgi:hypothetical protein